MTGVDMDPKEYRFYVGKEGEISQELNFHQWRFYSKEGPYLAKGGDRNLSYRYDDEMPATVFSHSRDPENYETTNQRFEETETLGFDMPKGSGISIEDGEEYRVHIRNTENGDVVFEDTFTYKIGK